MARLLITRPQADAERTRDALETRGHEGVIAPVLRIVPAPLDTRALGRDRNAAQAVLATSANAVPALAAAPGRRETPVYAVGPHTAAAARAAGFAAVIDAHGTAEDLAVRVITDLAPAAGPVLHLRGAETKPGLAARLAQAGFTVADHVAYRAEALETLPADGAQALAARTVHAVLFFSPRTAQVFGTLTHRAGLTGDLAAAAALCISPETAARLDRPAWGTVICADAPNLDAMLDRVGMALPGGSHRSGTTTGE